MTDNLKDLPTDETAITNREIEIIKTVFDKDFNAVKKTVLVSREIVYAGILFAILSLPFVKEQLARFVPITSNEYIGLGARVLIFITILFVIKNLHYLKK